jgi:polyhydroxyalkanoate synthesis regulator phasin
MPDETTVVTSPVESTGSQTTVSNDAKRISDLMSRGDKLQDQLNKLQETHTQTVLDKAEYQRKVSELAGLIEKNANDVTQVRESSAKAVEDAIKRLQDRENEMEAIRADNARLRIISENPDLAHYADLIPATTDVEKLTSAVEKIRNARNRDLETVKQSLQQGSTTALNPSRVQNDLSPEDVNKYLREAMNDPKEFEKRIAEVAAMPLRKR